MPQIHQKVSILFDLNALNSSKRFHIIGPQCSQEPGILEILEDKPFGEPGILEILDHEPCGEPGILEILEHEPFWGPPTWKYRFTLGV